MNVWLVIPCWRRLAVTRLCLAQKKHLIDGLAARGITASVVVVAADENLDIAAEYGFDTVEQKNVLGLKVNDGIEYACDQGADYVSFVGSDDWIHPDFFDPIACYCGEINTRHCPAHGQSDRPPLIAGHYISIIDMHKGTLRRLGVRGPEGVSPYLIPRWMLEPSGFRPVDDKAERGMEGLLRLGLPVGIDRVFHDPHQLTRIDFKTGENMTPYARISNVLGYGPEIEQPWEHLATRYPGYLAQMAHETHLDLALEVAA